MITKKKCYYNKSLKLTNQYYSRFCIDNSIMIAHAGLLTYRTGFRRNQRVFKGICY